MGLFRIASFRRLQCVRRKQVPAQLDPICFDGGTTAAINEQKLHELLGKGIADFGPTFHAALIAIGDKLSLYKGLAAGGHQTN
jgi:hypothetical protein